jgi:hypothetical protein
MCVSVFETGKERRVLVFERRRMNEFVEKGLMEVVLLV